MNIESPQNKFELKSESFIWEIFPSRVWRNSISTTKESNFTNKDFTDTVTDDLSSVTERPCRDTSRLQKEHRQTFLS